MAPKLTLFLLAFFTFTVAVASAIPRRYEVFPLTEHSTVEHFNISDYNPALYRVVELGEDDLKPDYDDSEFTRRAAQDDCTTGDVRGYCVGTETEGECNIAIRIPAMPTPHKAQSSGWLYTQRCERIIGCKLNNVRGPSVWWSIYSELKYAVNVHDNVNSYPYFEYAGFSCGRWCNRWSWIYDDPDNYGPSIYLYRAPFPCNQP
ncbi:hypothetical protein GQ53DRAFT_759918 [Thozetella sp. PMI_491]|nr:hypothetical protein GQ53DRAFT_759918 [Thozetella sp. PMI_491]